MINSLIAELGVGNRGASRERATGLWSGTGISVSHPRWESGVKWGIIPSRGMLSETCDHHRMAPLSELSFLTEFQSSFSPVFWCKSETDDPVRQQVALFAIFTNSPFFIFLSVFSNETLAKSCKGVDAGSWTIHGPLETPVFYTIRSRTFLDKVHLAGFIVLSG